MNARLRLLVLTAGFLLASGAWAQAILTLELGYSNPGARSLGFGGAFVALADDATAAYANPAGLVQLTRPEISIEGRSWSYKTPFVFSGRASGPPTGIGIDTSPDLRWGESKADFTGLSFLSYVHPLKNWSLAVYRHQLARFESAFTTNGVFAEGSTYLDTDRWIDRPGSADFDVVSWGFAAARRINDSFSLGLTLTYLEVDLDLETTAYLPDDDSLEAFFSANSYLPERSPWRTSTRAHGSTAGLALGFLWRASRELESGWLRSQPVRRPQLAGMAGPVRQLRPRTRRSGTSPVTGSFHRCSAWAVRTPLQKDACTGSFEWDYVVYSAIFEGDPDEAIPDAHELHLGGEYAFLQVAPLLAVRAGVWLDPDHRVRSTVG